VSESVALSIGFDDMDPVGETVEQSSGEAFGAKDLSPILEREIGSDHKTLAFVGPTDHLEEEFCPYLGKL
jgi:hypothetical protein